MKGRFGGDWASKADVFAHVPYRDEEPDPVEAADGKPAARRDFSAPTTCLRFACSMLSVVCDKCRLNPDKQRQLQVSKVSDEKAKRTAEVFIQQILKTVLLGESMGPSDARHYVDLAAPTRRGVLRT